MTLRISIRFADVGEEMGIDPLASGEIQLIIADSADPKPARSVKLLHLLLNMTDLLHGLIGFWEDDRQKVHVFGSMDGALRIRFERRKEGRIALLWNGEEIGIFPAEQVRNAFTETIRDYCRTYQGRFGSSSADLAEAAEDILSDFNRCCTAVSVENDDN